MEVDRITDARDLSGTHGVLRQGSPATMERSGIAVRCSALLCLLVISVRFACNEEHHLSLGRIPCRHVRQYEPTLCFQFLPQPGLVGGFGGRTARPFALPLHALSRLGLPSTTTPTHLPKNLLERCPQEPHFLRRQITVDSGCVGLLSAKRHAHPFELQPCCDWLASSLDHYAIPTANLHLGWWPTLTRSIHSFRRPFEA